MREEEAIEVALIETKNSPTPVGDGDPSDVSTSLPVAARPKRPKGMKGFVYDYIIDRFDRLKNGEQIDQILTSDLWYDLTD